MKLKLYVLTIVGLIFLANTQNLTAQEVRGGVVTYQHIAKYNFASLFKINEKSGEKTREWLAGLPKEIKKIQKLYFTKSATLYEEGQNNKAEFNKNLESALMKSAYVKTPAPELKKLQLNFVNNEKIEQVMFMTRSFLVSDKIDRKPWKLKNKMSKVLGYTCMSAELIVNDKSIIAWYTPKIPISAGPDVFYGLPGLVLAVQIDGDYTFVAKSIDLLSPKDEILSKLDKGKKLIRMILTR